MNAFSQKLDCKTGVKNTGYFVSVAAFVTTAIVIIYAFSIIWLNHRNSALVVALLVMLPRSLQIVMHLQVIQSYFANWKSLREKLKITEKSYFPFPEVETEKYINAALLRVDNKGQEIQLSDLFNLTENAPLGRYTVRGGNGCGKSTALAIVKRNCGADAVYIPAKHNFEIGSSKLAMSSGELALTTINTAKNSNERIILLDEWDANLSSENRIKVSIELDELSKTKCIVEVLHNEHRR